VRLLDVFGPLLAPVLLWILMLSLELNQIALEELLKQNVITNTFLDAPTLLIMLLDVLALPLMVSIVQLKVDKQMLEPARSLDKVKVWFTHQ